MSKRRLILMIILVVILVIAGFLINTKTVAENNLNGENPDVVFTEPEQGEKLFSKEELYEVQDGDTLSLILQEEAGLGVNETSEVVEKFNEVHSVNSIRIGQKFKFRFTNTAFASAEYEINKNEKIVIEMTEEGFSVEKTDIEYEIEIIEKSGVVSESFYMSGLDAGLADNTIMNMANIFASDMDFVYSIRGGEEFTLIYEKLYLEGEFVGEGDILAASFINPDEKFYAFLFQDDEGEYHYYDEDGNSKKKMLLKTPLNFSRISSGFSYNRKHPITGTFKSHRAIDFPASTGTLVETVGDGVVITAGWNGGYGKFIQVRHGEEFITGYAHLSQINVVKGQKVKQGEIIGKVGTTGSSTGPHLHYEMKKSGALVNPLKVDVPSGEPILEQYKEALNTLVSEYINRL